MVGDVEPLLQRYAAAVPVLSVTDEPSHIFTAVPG